MRKSIPTGSHQPAHNTVDLSRVRVKAPTVKTGAVLSDADKIACYSAASARFAEAMEAPDATTEVAELAAAETFIRILTAKLEGKRG